MRKLIISMSLAVGFLALSCMSKSTPKGNTLESGLTWYDIEDIESLVNDEPKPILIDMYTDWCGWCKVMDKKTFVDPGIVEYLSDHFYTIKFNAERKDTVHYQGEDYGFLATGRRGANQLAFDMLNGRLGYPTMVYLDKNLNKIKIEPGYKTPEQLMKTLKEVVQE